MNRLSLVAVLAVLAAPCSALACGFAAGMIRITTLREDAEVSKLIVYGTLANAKEDKDGGGTTDCLISSVLKPNPLLGDKKLLTLPRYVPAEEPNKPVRILIFFDVFEGKLDPYRGVRAQPAIVGYLKGLLALDAKNHTRRLRYCFDFLDHADPEIARDAFYEFMKTPDRDLDLAARKLSPEKLRNWLKDPKTDSERLRLYGFLLGCCGKPGDAKFLRDLAARLVKQDSPPLIDGVLTGYTLLAPKEGWNYIRTLFANSSNHVVLRLAGLRAARFFYNTRPDVISKKDVVSAIRPGIDQDDFADIPIEDLRGWRCWDLTDRILALDGKPAFRVPLMRRAILRYALQCPGPAAAALVAKRRKADPEMVKEVEEGLRLDAETR